MFQFSAFAPFRVTGLQPAGFPHSEILGSKIICISPKLIAAYHVFLRLSEPRHPPCALSNLFVSFIMTLIINITSINSNMSMNFETQSPNPITQYHMCSRLRDDRLKTLLFPVDKH